MARHRMATAVILIGLLAAPVSALAQDGLTVSVTTSQACADVDFEVQASGGLAPYSLEWSFGDGEVQTDSGIAGFPFSTSHTYAAAGEYAWSVLLADASDPTLTATTGGTVQLGPAVTLTSAPFPPLLTLESGAATVDFTATASGGEPPYSYAWDPDGDGVFDAGGETASFTYTAGGKYAAAVQVTDNCGLTTTAVLTVMVDDPLAEACHPMAERIADAVNTLFPTQAGQFYTCEDIFAIFQGSLTGHNLGFGRMWHAYKLAAALEDMTWEEILQWHLDQGGWGALVQLDRYAEALGDIGPGELVDMVLAGEATVGEIRTAMHMVTRFDADFAEALALAHEGANPGQLGQLYRTAGELGLDLPGVQAYLDQGVSLHELRQAARLAEQSGGDLTSILEAGVRETRRQQQEERRQEHQDAQSQQQLEQDARAAARLAERYGVTIEQVQALFDGACGGDWNCVQATLRDQSGGNGKGHGGGKP